MKNLTLLRLAGFGFFGAVFLSPAVPGQDEDWLLEKLNVAKKLTSLPFTMSALYRENYLTEPKINVPRSGSITRPNLFLSVLLPEDPPADTVILLQPHYDPLAKSLIAIKEMATPGSDTEEIESGSMQEDPQAQNIAGPGADTALVTSDETTPVRVNTDLYEEIETVNGTSNIKSTHLPEYVPDEQDAKEELFPPTQYVDEVPVSKPGYAAKISASALVPIITTQQEAGLDEYPLELMDTRIRKLAEYATANKYSTNYAFMLNIGLKSGKKRFFLVDLRAGTIVSSGLVAHGRGKEKFTLNKSYSNVYGSSCSSLGLYKVGPAYSGGFGKSFRLIGLQNTNNNALTRAIVLHAMSCIPNEEIDYPICQSEGCPSLSPEFLESISPVIKKSEKPMLLWIFDPAIDRDHMP